jgi:hypothetical protein
MVTGSPELSMVQQMFLRPDNCAGPMRVNPTNAFTAAGLP